MSVDDTVIVRNGTYSENIVLNNSLSLIGEGYPTVNAEQKGSAIRITVDGCVVIYVYNEKEYEGYMGNYWDDYTGKDEEGDGIGDASYKINEPRGTGVEDDSDDYPLVLPFKDYF